MNLENLLRQSTTEQIEGLVQNYCNYLILYKNNNSFAPSPRNEKTKSVNITLLHM